MGMMCFQLMEIPDLSLNKYQVLADTGIEGVLKRHESFLRQWHGICTESVTSFHLLYIYLPCEPAGKRLKAFFIIQGNDVELDMVKPLLTKSPLSDFFTFEEKELPECSFKAGATFTKIENYGNIQKNLVEERKIVHYVPKWEMNEEARLYDLFRMMESIGQSYYPQKACAFRVDLYPVSMVNETKNKFSPILNDLSGKNYISLTRETNSIRLDDDARDIAGIYEDWLTDIETTPHFRVNIYGFADDIFKAKVLLNSAGSEALSKGDFLIAPIKEDENGLFTSLSRMERQARDYSSYVNDKTALHSWSTTYCLSEVVPFFRFPTLYDGENIEIPKETAPIQMDEGIYLGEDSNGYSVNFALEDLPRHAFFTGMPGAGKTNTMLHLITQLHNKSIPFLAMEPAKKEYRELLTYKEMQDVCLFSPHLQSRFPLQMNPMEFPKGVRLSEHINALLEVFKGSFVLEGATYKFLSSSIQRAYTKLGWDIEDENTEDCGLAYPTLQDVYDNLQKEIETSSYESDIKGNLRAFLQVRLGGLMERDAGELFNVKYSTLLPEEWIVSSAIVELEVLGEQAKNFFVLLVCNYILETLRADPSGGIGKDGKAMPVRHVIFIEEAHNIIASSTQQQSTETVDPKISATAYIVKMLAEVRARREAIIIADQLPTALTSEVTKNTGLKLVHRLTAKDDREEIGTSISASDFQLERMATFTKGQALIYHEGTKKPFEMQVAEWKKLDVKFDYTNDNELFAELGDLATLKNQKETLLKNWNEKYVVLLDKRVSKLEKEYAKLTDLADKCDKLTDIGYLETDIEKNFDKCKKLGKLWNQISEYTDSEISSINALKERVDAIYQDIIMCSQ